MSFWTAYAAAERLPEELGIAADEAWAASAAERAHFEQQAQRHSLQVLSAFRRHHVSETDLLPSSGYGYHDQGRDKLEAIYAAVFGAEAALVRPQIVSGTHAISLMLFGCLRPGDELLVATGDPYDSLHGLLGLVPGTRGSLAEWGVTCRIVPWPERGLPDPATVAAAIGPQTRAVFLQRSRGYSQRPTIPVRHLGELIAAVQQTRPDIYCLVDNCYGEFVEDIEPGHVGADLVAGSLIKNPGGGLATTGGYVAGRLELVERAAACLTAPGVGREIGPVTGSLKREFFQGLLLAPAHVGQALQGAAFAAHFFAMLGLPTDPGPGGWRGDLIQAVATGSREGLIRFCQGLQAAAPIDSYVQPEPWAMPGYEHEVIMAAGTFTQGSTMELSADGPLRPPYTAYMQGGLQAVGVAAACLHAAAAMAAGGVLPTRRPANAAATADNGEGGR